MSQAWRARIVLFDKRIPTGFLLKGRGARKKKLTIADCDKNGDQILRLLRLPAELFIVQYVGVIDTAIRDLLEKCAEKKGRESQRVIYFCLIDGIDTAKLLKAYGKLCTILSIPKRKDTITY